MVVLYRHLMGPVVPRDHPEEEIKENTLESASGEGPMPPSPQGVCASVRAASVLCLNDVFCLPHAASLEAVSPQESVRKTGRNKAYRQATPPVVSSPLSYFINNQLLHFLIAIVIFFILDTGYAELGNVSATSVRWGHPRETPSFLGDSARRIGAAERLAVFEKPPYFGGRMHTHLKQHMQEQMEEQQQQQGWGFVSWVLDALQRLLRGLSCSTAAFACFSATANAACAALLLSNAWQRPFQAKAAKRLASDGNSSKSSSSSRSSSAVLPVERRHLWHVRRAMRAVGKAASSCCPHRSSSSNDKIGKMNAAEQQLLREKRWLPWLVRNEPGAVIGMPVSPIPSEEEDASEVAATNETTAAGVFDLDTKSTGVPDAHAAAAIAAGAEAAGEECWQLEWPGATYNTSCCSQAVSSTKAAETAAEVAAAAEAAALECLLQSYAHRPPMLQWVVYFVVAFLWAAQVYGLAVCHGPLLGTAPAAVSLPTSSWSSYEPAAASAQALLLLTELLLGVCLLGCLLYEAAFIIGQKKQQPRRRRVHAFVLLLCCCFGMGIYCFWTSHSSAAAAAEVEAPPFPAAAVNSSSSKGSFAFEQQQQQRGQQPLLLHPYDAAAAEAPIVGTTPVAAGDGEAIHDVVSLLNNQPASFLSFADGVTEYQLQPQQRQKAQQQARGQRHLMRHVLPATLLQLGPAGRYIAAYRSSSSSNNTGLPAAATAAEAETWEAETPAPRRRLNASPWSSTATARDLKTADEFGEDTAEESSGSNSSSSNSGNNCSILWSRVLPFLGEISIWFATFWRAFNHGTAGVLGILPICCLLLPLVLLRVAAAAVTLDLVRQEDALAQKRDSSQKNSLKWLVASVCMTSAQVLPLFIWLRLAREEGWCRWIPVRGVDPLLLLHSAASVALYMHLRKGCFRVGRKSLLTSIAYVHNTFNLVGP